MVEIVKSWLDNKTFCLSGREKLGHLLNLVDHNKTFKGAQHKLRILEASYILW